VCRVACVTSSLVRCCQSGGDWDICKAAWKLFYTVVKYQPGTLPRLLSTKLLKQVDGQWVDAGNSGPVRPPPPPMAWCVVS
jgi:hypothetical protein